ncbi:BON domain-containing protein [Robbsia sp. Bb-Pol-6]|uniref:BON domain-containing protein n=1 Tax=Robbsia betulipollinis TaxID=2981849 RepID=A0ABT3ZT26_9BURK|nr:BON domain-containing protein [Robbsia betulipollinis]MCY0389711.1 BON domain-containing protein [Robbsia betulipollinis]
MTVTRVKKGLIMAVCAFGIAATLQGCPLILLGGAAAGGALIATDRRTVGTQTDDREIQIRAAAQLSSDLPDQAHVDVAVFNRRVLIVGEVPDAGAKELATKIVRNVSNVESIVNELAIRGANPVTGRSNDSFITSKVKSSIVAEKDLSANYFKVVTERGVVYLMGLVTVDEGKRAADIASRVPGVVQVVKAYQYIVPEGAGAPKKPFMETTSADTSGDSTPASPRGNVAAADSGVTTGAIPSDNVSAQPLQQQAPAPIGNAASAQPGNPKAVKSARTTTTLQ